ncbi:MAG: S-layer homology domain-containing protein [Candidatus Ancillula trichonymphae]|nr:S-layer homology domain-containing protein [Candidatus Ancillula trichonymphae]
MRTSQFQDVPTNHQFYKEIAWLASQNITKTTNTYSPDGPVLRSQMALFLRRLAKSTSGVSSCGFQDAENINDSETRNATCWAKDKGITPGVDSAHAVYAPMENLRRDNMLMFLRREWTTAL